MTAGFAYEPAGTRRQPARRAGFGMVELVVALTILAVGVLGLAAAAAVAHRSILGAEAMERGVDAAAAVLDSLIRESAPVAGERVIAASRVYWTVRRDSAVLHITVTVDVHDGGQVKPLVFTAVHSVARP